MRCATLTVLSLLVVTAIGGVEPARKPSTGPTTRPDVEADLRRIIRGLQVQIAALKQDNAQLKIENEQLRKLLPTPAPATRPANPADPIATAIAQHTFAIGMTFDQAIAANGQPMAKIYEDATTKRYRWAKQDPHFYAVRFTIVDFDDGKITAITDDGFRSTVP